MLARIMRTGILSFIIIAYFFGFLILKKTNAHYSGGYHLCDRSCSSIYPCLTTQCDGGSGTCLNYCNVSQCGENRGCTGYYCPCTSILPIKPTNFRITNLPLSIDLSIPVNLAWDFNVVAQNCGKTDGWGLYCSGAGGGASDPVTPNNDHFRIYNSGGTALTSDLAESTRTTSIALHDWTAQSIKVCASNNGFITSSCSSLLNFTPISPTSYPTIAITGSLKQKSENSSVCYNATSDKYFILSKINITPGAINCITPACTGTPSNNTAYNFSCNVKFDNIQCQLADNTKRPTPSQALTIDAVAQDYSQPGMWIDPASTTCDTGNQQLGVSAINPTPINKSIYFNYNTRWIKLKDGSYSKPTATTSNNYIPAIPQAFDAEDSVASNYFIHQTAANAAGSTLGLNIGSYAKYSTNNWGSVAYAPQAQKFNTLSVFLDYIKSKKDYKTINSVNEIATSVSGVNLIDSDIEINDANKGFFDSNNSVLFLLNDHTLTFNLASFTPSKSIAFIANYIEIKNNVERIDGILIGNNISVLNVAGGNGLKINGNLISRNPISNARDIADNSKPSIFIFFKTKPYLDLLLPISSSLYDWKQTQ